MHSAKRNNKQIANAGGPPKTTCLLPAQQVTATEAVTNSPAIWHNPSCTQTGEKEL